MEIDNKTRAPRLQKRQEEKAEELRLQEGREDGGFLMARDLHVWKESDPPSPNRPLVVIAVSGGGIRAAVWTFAVLEELELAFAQLEPPVDFPSHVRIITGASGGIVGASYYVASLPHPDERPAREQRRKDLDMQQGWLGSDFLTPLGQRIVLSDCPCWLSPWPMRYDRGRALEQAWSRYLKNPCSPGPGSGPGALDVSFECLKQGEKAGWRPSLVISPMLIEDGRRLIISNLDMRHAISNDGAVLSSRGVGTTLSLRRVSDPSHNHSIEAMELYRLFPNAHKKFTVGTAARMSASFPYFSPAVSLPTVPRRRVVDAGYYDNYGVSLAASWLFSDPILAWRDKHHIRRILLIQIRDGITEKQRQLLEQAPDGSNVFRRALEELTSPPEGLYNASTSSSSFRNDGQLELLDKFQHLRPDKPPLPLIQESPMLVVNVELGEKVSLSWYLSKDEKQRIHDEAKKLFDPDGAWLEGLFQWWFWPAPEQEALP
jgi:hypothetical protein